MAIKKLNLAQFKPTLFKVPGKSEGEYAYEVKFLALNELPDDLVTACNELNIKVNQNTLTWEDYQRLYTQTSSVKIPNLMIPERLRHAVNYAYENFLKHPFLPDEIFWDTPDNFMEFVTYESQPKTIVPKPNHGLSHSVRDAAYPIPQLQHIQKHLNPKCLALFERYSEKKIHLLQVTALFSVVGRKDETGFHTQKVGAVDVYNRYKQDSANALMTYMRTIQDEWQISNREIEYYGELLTKFGDPAFIAAEFNKLQEIIENQNGYKIYVFDDQKHWEESKQEIFSSLSLNVHPIIFVGTDDKARDMYWYENGIVRHKNITLKSLDKSLLQQVNEANELVVNSENLVFVKQFLSSFNVFDSTTPFCHTPRSTGFLDFLLLNKSHTLDLYRCHEDLFDILMTTTFADVCVSTKQEQEDFENLMRFPLQVLSATGDRIVKNKLLDGNSSSKDYNYQTHALANTSPDFVIDRINALSSVQENDFIAQGPRPYTNATRVFNQLIKDLLVPNHIREVILLDNQNEIEIYVRYMNNGAYFEIYNITKLLEYEPDFEHLVLTDIDLEHSLVYLNSGKQTKNSLWNDTKTLTEAEFASHDPNREHEHLHHAEKIAIRNYSVDNNYQVINNLLRGHLSEAESKELLPYIINILITIAVASHGLSRLKPNPPRQFVHHESNFWTRLEVTNYDLKSERDKAIKGKYLFNQKGFFSASKNPRFNPDTEYENSIIIREPVSINPQSTVISRLTYYPPEGEVIFVPNTQFLFSASSEDNVLEAKPYRSIKDTLPEYRHHVLRLRSGFRRFREELTRQIRKVDPSIDIYIDALKRRTLDIDKADTESIKNICSELYYGLHVYNAYAQTNNISINLNNLLRELKRLTAPYRKLAYIYSSPLPWILPFHFSVASGNIELVKQLLEQNKHLKNTHVDGRNALHIAAYRHDYSMALFLLNIGFDPHVYDFDGKTALSLLTPSKNEDIIQALIQHHSLVTTFTVSYDQFPELTLMHSAATESLPLLRIYYQYDHQNVSKVALSIIYTRILEHLSDLKDFIIRVMFLAIENNHVDLQKQILEKWKIAYPKKNIAEYLISESFPVFYELAAFRPDTKSPVVPDIFIELYRNLIKHCLDFRKLKVLLQLYPTLLHQEVNKLVGDDAIKTASLIKFLLDHDVDSLVPSEQDSLAASNHETVISKLYSDLIPLLDTYRNVLHLIPADIKEQLLNFAKDKPNYAEFRKAIATPGIFIEAQLEDLSVLVSKQLQKAQRIPTNLWMTIMINLVTCYENAVSQSICPDNIKLEDFVVDLSTLSVSLKNQCGNNNSGAQTLKTPLRCLIGQAFKLCDETNKFVSQKSKEFIYAKRWLINFDLRMKLLDVLQDIKLDHNALKEELGKIKSALTDRDRFVKVGFIPAHDLLNDTDDQFLDEVKRQGFHRIVLTEPCDLQYIEIYKKLMHDLREVHGFIVLDTIARDSYKYISQLISREVFLDYGGRLCCTYFSKIMDQVCFVGKDLLSAKVKNDALSNQSDSSEDLCDYDRLFTHFVLTDWVKEHYLLLQTNTAYSTRYLAEILAQPFEEYHPWARAELAKTSLSAYPKLFSANLPVAEQEPTNNLTPVKQIT